ncbi:hypothetical protein ElyMa_004988300 [Elysia marginata]|uniref:Uncharacterized protein n=1 Tax=Elysia marginata TaxID=1093978 RepID=A0AAV4J6R7_9GAST|nr:hypothetical protein ElyMa_004988300 [Elysia marginata]
MDHEEKVSPEELNSNTSERRPEELDHKNESNNQNDPKDRETSSCVASKDEKSTDEIKETECKSEKPDRNLGLDLECISDTKSEHDPIEEVDEYYESISEEEAAAAQVDDISSSEDEHFADTVPKHTFEDLPFVPKAEFSSELLNTVKEEKFNSEENNFNRKPFSSSVQTLSNSNSSSQLVHRVDFSVPPPNFQYNSNQNVNFSAYGYDQAGYYNGAQQSYEQHPWYGNQTGYDPASFANQQYYPGPADYQNYNQAAYQNYYHGAYNTNQQYNYESNFSAQSASGQTVAAPLHASTVQTPSVQNYQLNPAPHANSNVVENVNVHSVAKSDSGVLKNVCGDSFLKRNTLVDSAVTSGEKDQISNSTSCAQETIARPISYKPSSAAGDTSPTADWLDENGDPIKGAFDFVASEDSLNSPENKSSKVEYVFSVRSSKSAKDPSTTTGVEGIDNTLGTAKTGDSKQSLTPNAGLSLSEQIAVERAKVTQKEVPVDEEKKLYEASKNGEEYKAALQAALATTSLAKVTPSTSKLLAENPLVPKERVNRFKRMQFTNQSFQHQPDQPNSEGAAVPFKKTEQDVALESQAITEILKEVQHGAARAKQYGALAWQKNRVPAVNKTFLHNTLVSTLRKPYKPPSKRGGRPTQGLHDRDSSRSSSSSRSSRSYSSDSRSSRSSRSSSRSSRSSYSSSSDSDRSRSPGYYEEAWAAYAAQFGYPWMGPDAYGMFYGPDGWPMDGFDPMFYGDPQAWAEYEAFYGPQNFNPRARGRGFRGRGRNWGRGMEFRGRGRDADFRGRGWGPPDFRGGGRGMEFRGRPPRGFPFSPHGRGLGPRYPGGRECSRSRSRSRGRESNPEFREGSRYKGSSRNTSRAGSRKSRSRSRSPNKLTDRKPSRDRSKSQSKDSQAEKDDENDSKDKSKKKKKKKHRKSKKKKDKSKNDDGDDQPKSEEKNENPSEKPTEQGNSDQEKDNNDQEDKAKVKKSKRHNKRKRKEGKRRKNKEKNEEGLDAGKDGDSSRKQADKEGGSEKGDKDINTGHKEQSREGSKEKQLNKKKRKDREKGYKSDSSKDTKSEAGEDKCRGKDYPKGKDKKTRREENERPSSGNAEYSSDRDRRNESLRKKEEGNESKKDNRGEALENDLRLKLKARREQRLLQGEEKKAKTIPDANVKGITDSRQLAEDKDKVEKTVDDPSGSVKRKKMVKKKKSSDGPTCGDNGEPKQTVKKKIIVKRKKVKQDAAGTSSDPAPEGNNGKESSVGQLIENNSEVTAAQAGGVEETQTKGVKRKRIVKRIVKRKIIVKRKKLKVNPDSEEAAGFVSSQLQDNASQLAPELSGQNDDKGAAEPDSAPRS